MKTSTNISEKQNKLFLSNNIRALAYEKTQRQEKKGFK